MIHTPLSRYHEDTNKHDFIEDPAQLEAVQKLQDLYDALVEHTPPALTWAHKIGLKKAPPIEPVKGLYFWGGVGRGKTYLVDMFYDCLPFENKLRMHFHRFMQRVHNERKALTEQSDPLVIVAQQIAAETRVLCFDEFVVTDVADAVILVKLLETLFAQGVTLVATSNVEPKELYKGGLQRDLFLPAIDLIYRHTDVANIDSGTDYRLMFLDKAETYFTPLDEKAHRGMIYNFEHLAPEPGTQRGVITVEGRDLEYVRRADGVIWFSFNELCDGPRSQNDYIELARTFHSVLISETPQLDRLKEDQARRFINLIDVLYDHNVKVIMSSAVPVMELYKGTRVEFEFQRTLSRLQEMQSHDYLALSHKL
jgi:cell division protein ZapE